MIQNIFSEFTPSSKEEWKNQAIRDLRGKDFNQSLKSMLWDKVEIQPFYTQEDVKCFEKFPKNSFEDAPLLDGFPARTWSNFMAVYPTTQNQKILDFLENGGNGLVLHISGEENLEELLKEVMPDYICIMIKPLSDPVRALHHFTNWVRKIGVEESELSGGLLWSPIDLLFEEGKSWDKAVSIFKEVIATFPESKRFHACMFNFSRYAEAGATGLDELIFGFGEVVELIAQSGIDPTEVFEKCGFYTSVGELHFPEIAKLKAIRFFAAELAFQYGVDLRLESISILAQTSGWSKSTLDPNTNLIRQTYEAMAAVLGGANGLWIQPISGQNTTDLELRIARNVSFILDHESHFSKVSDPAAGSYYLDSLVALLMKEVKIGLQELESTGGWLKSFESRAIHQLVRECRLKQQHAVLSGQNSKIGANKYPASQQLKKDREFSIFLEKDYELNPSRASYLVELQNQEGK